MTPYFDEQQPPMAPQMGAYGSSAAPAWTYPAGVNRRAPLPRVPFLGVSRGTPGTTFRPGGQGAIPSMQRLLRLAPTERAGLQGYYESELGVPWEDVEWLSRRNAPRSWGFSGAPRWASV